MIPRGAKPFEHRVPLAERVWQITPWAACPSDPENRLDEKPEVRAGATGVTFPAKTVSSDDRPLRVAQCHTDQGCLPFGNLESLGDQFGNPQTSTDPSYLSNKIAIRLFSCRNRFNAILGAAPQIAIQQ